MLISNVLKDKVPQSVLDKMSEYKDYIPEHLRRKIMLKVWTLLNVPLIHWVRPKIIEMNDERMVFQIPLNWRTKNHLGSLYFGALVIGADASSGFLAVNKLEQIGKPYSLVFKDLKANFFKRAEGDTVFTCTDGQKISELIEKAVESKEREETMLTVTATCPDCLGQTPVAQFEMTLSIKIKEKDH